MQVNVQPTWASGPRTAWVGWISPSSCLLARCWYFGYLMLSDTSVKPLHMFYNQQSLPSFLILRDYFCTISSCSLSCFGLFILITITDSLTHASLLLIFLTSSRFMFQIIFLYTVFLYLSHLQISSWNSEYCVLLLSVTCVLLFILLL